jgi:hypothetical protein
MARSGTNAHTSSASVPQVSTPAGRGSRPHSRSVTPADIPIRRRAERRAGKTSRGRARPAEEEGRTVGTTVPRGYSSESRRLRTRVVRKYRAVDRFFKAIESDFEVGSDLEVESDLQHPPHTLILRFGKEERFSGHRIDTFLSAGRRERSRKRLLYRILESDSVLDTKASTKLRLIAVWVRAGSRDGGCSIPSIDGIRSRSACVCLPRSTASLWRGC